MNNLISDLLKVEPDKEYLRTIFSEVTYSPEDNKLRLYPNFRFDKELWLYFRSIGMRYASKQELFVFAHRISREDLCLFLLPDDEEIQPEGTTLAERAEIKAERLEGYYNNRVRDMNAYSRSASRYSERFAQGQPILIGHHSEKSARRDQKRADTAMRNSLDHGRRADYWSWKVGGVAHYANMKADAGVRTRRIETLLKELRDLQRSITSDKKTLERGYSIIDNSDDEPYLSRWGDNEERTNFVAHVEEFIRWGLIADELRKGNLSHEIALEIAVGNWHRHVNFNDYKQRSIMHLLNRLSYENSLLPEVEKFSPSALTNAILKRFLVKHGFPASPKEIKLKLDKKTTMISVKLSNSDVPLHFGEGDSLEYSQAEWCEKMHELGYTVPAPKPKPKPVPILNINKVGKFMELKANYGTTKIMEVVAMTKAEFQEVYHDYRGTSFSIDNKYRFRICKGQNSENKFGHSFPWVIAFQTDSKEHEAPDDLDLRDSIDAFKKAEE